MKFLKYLGIIWFSFFLEDAIAQSMLPSPLDKYPIKENTDFFTKRIWLGKGIWESIDDETGRVFFYTRAHAKKAVIKLIPILKPSVEKINEYDSTKNILDFLVAEKGSSRKSFYMAMIYKEKKLLSLVECNPGLTCQWLNFDDPVNNMSDFLIAFSEGYPVYYDAVVNMYCYIKDGRVFVHYPYKKQWVPYYEIIGKDGLNGYKELVKSRAKK